jgi:hypothetical protein
MICGRGTRMMQALASDLCRDRGRGADRDLLLRHRGEDRFRRGEDDDPDPDDPQTRAERLRAGEGDRRRGYTQYQRPRSHPRLAGDSALNWSPLVRRFPGFNRLKSGY